MKRNLVVADFRIAKKLAVLGKNGVFAGATHGRQELHIVAQCSAIVEKTRKSIAACKHWRRIDYVEKRRRRDTNKS